jgi:hypothetical protein
MVSWFWRYGKNFRSKLIGDDTSQRSLGHDECTLDPKGIGNNGIKSSGCPSGSISSVDNDNRIVVLTRQLFFLLDHKNERIKGLVADNT